MNVDFDFAFDPQVQGYKARIDIRDNGIFTLQVRMLISSRFAILLVVTVPSVSIEFQVVTGWFFGDGQPGIDRVPILVGGHLGHTYNKCHLKRALLGEGPIQVSTLANKVPPHIQRFGTEKCKGGDSPGRWLAVRSKCQVPYCTGDRQATVNFMDWVMPVKSVFGNCIQ